jgi:NADPH:quinone reductase-like Zn-dependent oxidoreductase
MHYHGSERYESQAVAWSGEEGQHLVSIVDEPDPSALAARGIRGESIRTERDPAVLEELTKFINARKVMPTVAGVFPLTDVSEAHNQIAARHTRGKIVLKIGDNATTR